MLKEIKILLDTPAGTIEIGHIKLETNIVNAYDYHMLNTNEKEIGIKEIFVEQWGSAKVICEDWVYFYHVNIFEERKANQDLFYYVEVGKLHGRNGYLSEVIVGEKLDTDDSIVALRMFTDKAIELLERG